MEDQVEEVIEDVEETTQETPVVEESLDRDQVMDELAKKRRDELESEVEGLEEVDEQLEEEVDTVEEELQEDPDETIDINVNGRIIKKTKAEVEASGGVVALQKTLAADQMFQQVASERRELEQLKAELEAQKTTIPDLSNDEAVDSFIESVYSGDEAKAKTAFKNALGAMKGRNEPVDEGRIVQETLFRLDQENGIKDFESNFSHLSTDPNLRGMVNERTIQIRQQSPDMSPSEVIHAAAEEVNAWVQGLAGEAATPVIDQVNRKQTIRNIRTATARVKQETGYKPKTQAEIFAEQKANRSH